MIITLIKGLANKLVPCYNSDYEIAKKIPLNEPIEFEFKLKRNVKFHRKYFAMLNLVLQNTDKFKDINHLRAIIAIEIGYYDELVNPLTGELKIIPKSISFDKMDETEFNELYNKSIDYCCKVLCIDNQTLIDELAQHF